MHATCYKMVRSPKHYCNQKKPNTKDHNTIGFYLFEMGMGTEIKCNWALWIFYADECVMTSTTQ